MRLCLATAAGGTLCAGGAAAFYLTTQTGVAPGMGVAYILEDGYVSFLEWDPGASPIKSVQASKLRAPPWIS